MLPSALSTRHNSPASASKSHYDQDDVAVSAFHSVFLGVRKQKYELNDRDDFWRLLLTIAERKIAKRIRYELQDKRDVRRVVRNSVFLLEPTDASHEIPNAMESLAGTEPTPEFAAEVSETCESLFDSLPDETSRRIAQLKLENHTADEIAAKLGCTRRTVQRKLLVIRKTWQHASGIEAEPDEMSQSEEERALTD
ncbi:MAG: HTH domain-containing protein [Fuerstiella sp.]|nr:HTH domain-containing protein [Fuerstiella sp.]MCP4856762.1 HTH domain-containing protein [Fuerstiella sp.]